MTKLTQTKADKLRAVKAKALASATKALEATTLEHARDRFVADDTKSEGKCRVYALALNHEFQTMLGESPMLHWTDIAKSANAAREGDNLKPLFELVKIEKAACLATAETRGHTNASQVWSRVTKMARSLSFPAAKRERVPVDMLDYDRPRLVACYKHAMAEPAPTEAQCEYVMALGRFMVHWHRIDLSAINTKN